MMNFDSVFFLCFGVLSLVLGILNKGGAFWMFFPDHRINKGKSYKRIINIGGGFVSIVIGLALLNKK